MTAIAWKLEDVLSLRSAEGTFYRACCARVETDCRCPRSRQRYYDRNSSARDLLMAKRNDEGYALLVEDLRRDGQLHPVKICRNGCCLCSGHHRIAALNDLGASSVWVVLSGHCCQPAGLS